MRALTPEEEKFLVDFCMDSKENIWLGLSIGQIQTRLRDKILSWVLAELENSVREKLKEVGLNWKPFVPERNLEAMEAKLFELTLKDQEIEIGLYGHGWSRGLFVPRDLFVGTHAKFKSCPEKDTLKGFFKDTNLNLQSNPSWKWFIYLEGGHGSLEELSTLNDDNEVKRRKIDYLTDILVRSAEAISTGLKD